MKQHIINLKRCNSNGRISKSIILLLIEHAPIFIVVAIYYGYCLYIEHILKKIYVLKVDLTLLGIFSWVTLASFCFFFTIQLAVRYLNNDIPGLLPKWHDVVVKYFNLKNIGGFIVIYTMFPIVANFYSYLKGTITLLNPFNWDVTFMKLDYVIHFHQHPWIILSGILQNDILLRLFDLSYISWYFVLHAIVFWLAWTRRRVLRLQFFVCNILILFIIGNCLATVLSSAGPCYYGNIVKVERNNPYEPLMQRLHELNEQHPLFALMLQNKLLDDYNHKGNGEFLAISAMPSVHVAYVTMFALAFSSLSFSLGLGFWIYWAIIQIGSIILGWHYAIDGYLATVITIILWRLSGFFNYCFRMALPERIRIEIFNSG